MSPLIDLANSLLPGLVKIISRDQTGEVGTKVEAAVREKTGANTAPEAKARLDAQPQVVSDLQTRLAEIALEAHRADLDAEAAATEADLAYNVVQADDTQSARDTLKDLIKLSDPISYTPSILSYVVVIGFFAALLMIASGYFVAPPDPGGKTEAPTAAQMINLLFGALAAAFATVVNFWLGSSFGSRRKDAASATAEAVEQVASLSGRAPAAGGAAGPTAPAPLPSPASGAGAGAGGGVERPGAGTTRPASGLIAGIPAAIVSAAQTSNRTWGIPASVSLAQFGLESAWGTRMPAGSNNPFGIKAVAGQPSVVATTREVLGGRSRVLPQRFRKFASFDEAFDQHGRLLATSRYYAAARKTLPNADAFARALTGVYATDGSYGDKLIAVMKSRNLYQFDLKQSLTGRIKRALT